MSKTAVRIALIGLDRLTGSIGLALHEHMHDPKSTLTFQIVGQDGDKRVMESAKHFGCVDETEGNTRTAVKNADIVFVSLPPGVLTDVYEYFAPSLKAGAVVLDMSTLKKPVLDIAAQHFPRDENGKQTAYLVGIQPLVNNAHLFEPLHTVEVADAKLFEGSEMIIAASTDCPEDAIKLATDVADILGLRPWFLVPEEYDALAAYTANLPALLAMTLFATIQASRGHNDLARTINPEFALMLHSLNRYAGQDLRAIWMNNRDASLRRIDDMIGVLNNLRSLLTQDDSEETEKFFNGIVEDFEKWQFKREKRKWEEQRDPLEGYGAGTFLASLFGFGGRQIRKADQDKK